MLRASSYVVYVDLPDTDQELLLVHGYTGAYDRVSRGVATYVRSLEARRAPKPLYGEWTDSPSVPEGTAPPSSATLEILRRRGYLTELTLEQESEIFARLATSLHERKARQMPSYIFMPTYQCNLRCAYCFQDHMRTDPRFAHLLRTMTPQMVDRIFAAMPRIEALHGIEPNGSHHRRIGFFGGEPLLAENRSIVEHIMTQARSCGSADFWAVSNATDLDAYADLLGPGQLADIQVTLDGPPAEHDQRRIYADGSGSFERIASNVTLALTHGAGISVRLNLDRNNIATLPRLADEIIDRGWDRHPGFSAYTAPIRAENDKTDARSTFSTWELDKALVELRSRFPQLEVIRRPDDGIKNRARRIFSEALAEAPSYREAFCAAHQGMYLFDVFGDIYACWEKTGDTKVRSGYVTADGNVVIDAAVNALWRSRTVASNPVCRSCRYALYCGGGCAVLAMASTGKYHANFCDGFANRFRANVAEAYLEHIGGVELAVKKDRVCDM